MDQAKLARMQRLIPVAQKWSAQTGIPAEVFLAINNFESNFGNNPQWGALFGMTGSGTAGKVTLQTSAGPLTFAAYNSPDEAYEHFVRVVSTSPNYASAWQNRTDPTKFFAGLQAGGYAGDHNDEDRAWSKNITATIDSTIRPAMKQAGVTPGAAPQQAAAIPGQQTQDPAKVDAFGAVVALGQKEIGKRYAGPIVGESDAARWGNPGWDCSSFVSGVYKQMGVNLTPYTDAAYKETRAISQDQAKPGDIIFYRGGSEAQPNIAYHHMGIYMGGGKVLSALYNGGVQVHDIAAPDGIKQGWEIRRAPGIEAAQVPAAAQQAIATGKQVAQSGGAGVTTPPTGQQPARRAENDPILSQAITDAQSSVSAYRTARDAVRDQIAKTTDAKEKLRLQTVDLPLAEKALSDANDQLIKLISYNKTEPGVAQANEVGLINAQTGAANARTSALNAQVGLLGTIYQGLGAAFGQDSAIATLVYNAIQANVANRQAYYKALLDKNAIDVQGYASLLTADAAKYAAHVSAAVESRQLAAQFGEQERWNAINLINDGVAAAGLPGLPDLNTARQKLGLPVLNIPVNRVDPNTFKPENLYARAKATANLPNPDTVFNPDIASMRGAVQTNQQLQIPAPQEITFGDANDPTKGVVRLPVGNIPANLLSQDGQLPQWLLDHINPFMTPPAGTDTTDTGGTAPTTGVPTGTGLIPGTVSPPGSIAGFQNLENQAGPVVPVPDPRTRNPSGGYLTGAQQQAQLGMGRNAQNAVPGSAGVPGQSSPTFVPQSPNVANVPQLPASATQAPSTQVPASATQQVNPAGDVEIDPVTGQRRRRLAGGFYISA